MKKIYIILNLFLIIFCMKNVNADTFDKSKVLFVATNNTVIGNTTSSDSTNNTTASTSTPIISTMNTVEYDDECGVLGNPEVEGTPAHTAQQAFDIIKYIGIIACVALSIYDFFKALFSDDGEISKELVKKLITRMLLAVALFFLPILIKGILYIVGVYGYCAVS